MTFLYTLESLEVTRHVRLMWLESNGNMSIASPDVSCTGLRRNIWIFRTSPWLFLSSRTPCWNRCFSSSWQWCYWQTQLSEEDFSQTVVLSVLSLLWRRWCRFFLSGSRQLLQCLTECPTVSCSPDESAFSMGSGCLHLISRTQVLRLLVASESLQA